jgi:hypothetical protein
MVSSHFWTTNLKIRLFFAGMDRVKEWIVREGFFQNHLIDRMLIIVKK